MKKTGQNMNVDTIDNKLRIFLPNTQYSNVFWKGDETLKSILEKKCFAHDYNLEDYVIIDAVDGKELDISKTLSQLMVKSVKMIPTVTTPPKKLKEGEKSESLLLITPRIFSQEDNKEIVFGIPLEYACEAGKMIPPFLYSALNRLQDYAEKNIKKFKVQEIFSPLYSGLLGLDEAKDNIEKNFKNVETISIHLLAALVSAFFDELPEDIIEPPVFTNLVSVIEIIDDKWRQNVLHSILLQVPTKKKTILKFLLNRISKLASLDSQSEEEALSYLSICLGPYLFSRKPMFEPLMNPLKNRVLRKRSRTLGYIVSSKSLAEIPISPKYSSSDKSKKNKGLTPERGSTKLTLVKKLSNSNLEKVSENKLEKSLSKSNVSQPKLVEPLNSEERVKAGLLVKQLVKDLDTVFQTDQEDLKIGDYDGVMVVCAATIDKIFDKLVDDHYHYQDRDFKDIFFMTYDYFSPSTDVLRKLIDIYNAEYSDSPKFWQTSKRVRICALIQIWTVERFNYLRQDKNFKKILRNFVRKDNHVPKETNLLRSSWKRFKANLATTENDIIPSVPDTDIIQAVGQMFLELPVVSIVQHLALVDQSFFKKITAEDCLHGSWQDKTKSPNFAAITNQINKFVFWIQWKLLSLDDTVKRREMVAKVIDIAIESVNIGNFNTAMSLYTALNSVAISRLKITFKDLPRKAAKQIEELAVLFDFQKNYNTYRTKLSDANQAVPILGIITKDLFALEENYPTQLKNLINWDKLRQLYGHIKFIKNFQKNNYDFARDTNIFMFLSNLSTYTEEELYRLSLKVEPQSS